MRGPARLALGTNRGAGREHRRTVGGVATRTTISWTEVTWNPVTGCDRLSPGCDHCLDPDTPVLLADLSWRPIGELGVGDELVAFTDNPAHGQDRIFERARVLEVWRVSKPAVEVSAAGPMATWFRIPA